MLECIKLLLDNSLIKLSHRGKEMTVSKKPTISIKWKNYHLTETKFGVFRDWYDVADWIKQENLAGRPVIILEWNYNH